MKSAILAFLLIGTAASADWVVPPTGIIDYSGSKIPTMPTFIIPEPSTIIQPLPAWSYPQPSSTLDWQNYKLDSNYYDYGN